MCSARAVFFDRDGTLMEEVDYCRDPSQVRVFPGVRDALASLKRSGFLIFIVTNQSGIGRGYFTECDYLMVQNEFLRQAGEEYIDGSYFAPDAPDQPSNRRKPAPGMLLAAATEHGVDLASSFMVGDKASDVECGRRAGTRTILVLTGYGAMQDNSGQDFTALNASEAVAWILREVRSS
jgi:D-glycero-D-manno-heptose 1,7-bisphosphate phosphatase